MANYDVIVIGAGGVGSAALYHLARRGVRALALDRFPPGHDRGSSHGRTRIIRQAYFEHPNYVPLLKRSYELWTSLEEAAQERLFHRVGLVEVGPPDGVVIPGVRKTAAAHQLPVEAVDAGEFARRWPGFHLPEGSQAVYEKEAGYLLVENCVLAHLRLAGRMGAQHQYGSAVTSWQIAGDSVTVETESETFSAARLVVAAGAWTDQLLATLSVPLEVRRKHVHWFVNSDSRYRQESGCPTFFYEMADGSFFYGFPHFDDLGVKVAEHSGGEAIADPLQVSRDREPRDERRIREFVARHLPGVSDEVEHHTVCLYTMTPDEHFLVDQHPHWPQVAFAAGLSGHGFKFTSVLGEILADLALDGRTAQPIGFLGVNRPGLKRA